MSPPPETTALMLGELKGQLRELIHNVNTLSAKIDAVTERVIGAAGVPARVKELEERIAALEADRNKREGALGMGGWLLRSPLAAWAAAALVAWWSLLKGRP